MTAMSNINSVEDVRGRPLDAVCFVADYVELHFSGAVLRFLLHPVRISADSERIAFPGPGSCDLLRSLVGRTATQVIMADESMSVHLEGPATVTGRIDESDPREPESVQFVPWENGRLNVAAMETW